MQRWAQSLQGWGNFRVVVRGGGSRSGTGTGSRGGELRSGLVATSQGASPVPSFGVTPSPSPCRVASGWKGALLHSQGNGLAGLRSFLPPF